MRAGYRDLSFSAHRIKIRIEGFRTDRLLDKAIKKGLLLRDIRIISPLQVVCWTTKEDYRELKKLAGALYRLSIQEERGVGFRAGRFLRRPVAVAGVLLVLALVIGQSFFIRTIEISGYKAIPETLLRQCLSESGVEEGAFRPQIDWQAAKSHIYETFPQVTWLRLVYDGRKVFLDIAEAEDPVVTEDFDRESSARYSNIVAIQSGYVETVSAYRGLALVEEEQFVQKGQVLISGYVPLTSTTYDEDAPEGYYVRSSGEIWARVPYRLHFNQERYIIPAAGAGGEAEGAESGIVASRREKTEEEARSRAEQQLRQWAEENLPAEAQILNKDLNFSYKENIIEVGMTIEVRQQIGEEQEILIGEESTDTQGDRQG